MATIYIDPSAGTDGAGTFADPRNTVPTFSSNNTYLFASGRTLSGSGTLINFPAGNTNIVVGVYDPLTGSEVKGWSGKLKIRSDGQYPVRVNTSAHGAVISMLDVSSTYSGSNGRGILIGNSATLIVNNVKVVDCDIHDLTEGATAVGVTCYGNNFEIRRCNIWNISEDGLRIYGSNAVIVHNNIWDVDQDNSMGDCIQIVGNADISCNNNYIAFNRLTNPNGNKQSVILQDTTGGSSGGVIEHNHIEIASGGSNQPIYVEVDNFKVRNNVILGGYYGIFMAGSGCEISGNIISQFSYRGVHLEGGRSLLKANNNTVIGSGASSGIFLNTSTDSTAKNNVITGCGIGLSKHGSATEDYNCYHGNSTDRGNTGGTPSWGSHSIFVDPMLTGNGRPALNSPLLTSGADLGYLRDITGKQCRKHIGAYGAARLVPVDGS